MMKVSSKDTKLICVGSIGKPRGLKGEFFLNSFCDPQENICKYSNFLIENNIQLKISSIKKSNSKFISKISSVDDLDGIKQYTNLKIFIKKSELPELNEREFYWHELIGMKVIDINNNDYLGDIKEISNYGSNDILEVIHSSSSIDSTDRKIPFVNDVFVKNIDSENKQIYVDWPKDF